MAWPCAADRGNLGAEERVSVPQRALRRLLWRQNHRRLSQGRCSAPAGASWARTGATHVCWMNAAASSMLAMPDGATTGVCLGCCSSSWADVSGQPEQRPLHGAPLRGKAEPMGASVADQQVYSAAIGLSLGSHRHEQHVVTCMLHFGFVGREKFTLNCTLHCRTP